MAYVLDASLILANLNAERGGERLPEFCDDAVISIITYVEVVTKLMDGGAPFLVAERSLGVLGIPLTGFDEAIARRAAELRETTRVRGLSLADRICLATAESRGAIAVTADRAWDSLDLGIAIELVR